MKKLMFLFVGLLFVGSIVLSSCSKDDYDAPSDEYISNPIELPHVENPIELPKVDPHA